MMLTFRKIVAFWLVLFLPVDPALSAVHTSRTPIRVHFIFAHEALAHPSSGARFVARTAKGISATILVIHTATAQVRTSAPPPDFSWKAPPGLAEGIAGFLLSLGIAYLVFRGLRPYLKPICRALTSAILGVLLFGSITYWQTATNRALGWR